MNEALRTWPFVFGGSAIAIAVLGGVVQVSHDVKRARDADRADLKAHHDECVSLRTSFVKVCLEERRGITQCQIDWSQVRGQAFDSPLDAPWAQEVNCSQETK